MRRATPEGLCFIHSVAPPPNARVLSIMPFMTSTILLYVTVKERVTVTSDNGLPRSSLRLLTLWPIVREGDGAFFEARRACAVPTNGLLFSILHKK